MPKAKAPKAPKASKTQRCQFEERGRRCGRNGTGSPCLCRPHRLVLEEAARAPDRSSISDAIFEVLDRGRVKKQTFERALDELGQMVSDALSGQPAGVWIPPAWQGARQVPRSQPQTPPRRSAPPPPPDPKVAARARARRVLGFGPDEPLDEITVKRRQRELAKKFHPDLGGSVDRMAEVNNAADTLLAAM